ncbi:helix-turn-helix domain-containing protein [Tissierella carlieri]|uniref:Helix-turn-helix domain-containing protein n=1 Tax=Tissierella carlieri TaxID=689904 RepID=A0ABT1SFI4_9FIRM|nr:helix-turn-helix domain-containing protein [Tissierella carlieri]
MKFGANLRKLRAERDMSQVELSKLIGVTSQAISQYELGKRVPDATALLLLSDIFNVYVDSLLKGDISMRSRNNNCKEMKDSEFQGFILDELRELRKDVNDLRIEANKSFDKLSNTQK